MSARTSSPSQRIAAIAVHALTASGAAFGLLALERAIAGDYVTMFAWLAVALLVDGVDGSLARLARVREHAAWVDGDTLDLVVDFLTYVVVPALALWRSGLMAAPYAAIAALLIVASSALYFADRRMKTHDHWFRGFPALWNVLALYLFVYAPQGWACFLIIVVAAAAMFAPIVFVHPMRVTRLRALTNGVGAVWLVCAALIVADGFRGPAPARWGLALAALYFVMLPLTRRNEPASGASDQRPGDIKP